jgi:hypothetical protein
MALNAGTALMHFNLVMRRKNMLRAGKFGFKTRPRDIASFVPASGYRALLSKIHLLNLKEVKAIVAAQAEHEALVGRSEWVEEQWRLTKREKAWELLTLLYLRQLLSATNRIVEALNVLETPPLSEEVIDEELEKLGWSEVPTDVGDGEAPVA